MGRSTFGAGETDLNHTSKKIVTYRKIYKAIVMLKNIVLHTFLKTIYVKFHLIWNFLLLLFFSWGTKVDRKCTGSCSLECRVQRKVKRSQGQNVPKQDGQNVLNNTLYVLVLVFYVPVNTTYFPVMSGRFWNFKFYFTKL